MSYSFTQSRILDLTRLENWTVDDSYYFLLPGDHVT